MKLTDISTIRQLFEKHGFSFTKSLGQNFLINPTVCPKIAEMGGAGKNVGAIEIGTGIGVLTRELAERCEKVVAIEIDTGLKPILDETLEEYDNVEVIFADVMETDLNKLIAEKFPDMDVTASINYYAKPKKLFRVNRGSFMPAPNVDSAVISLERYEQPPYKVDNEPLFFEVIKQAFAQRRKQLANPVSAYFKIPKAVLAEKMTEGGIPATARAEQLTMSELVKLYEIINELKFG